MFYTDTFCVEYVLTCTLRQNTQASRHRAKKKPPPFSGRGLSSRSETREEKKREAYDVASSQAAASASWFRTDPGPVPPGTWRLATAFS